MGKRKEKKNERNNVAKDHRIYFTHSTRRRASNSTNRIYNTEHESKLKSKCTRSSAQLSKRSENTKASKKKAYIEQSMEKSLNIPDKINA